MSKLKKFFRVLACGLTVAVIVGGAYLTCEYWDTLVGNDKAQISPLPDDEDKPDVTLTHIVKFVVDGEETVRTVANGECLTDIEDPVKEGYIFKGWYIGNTKIDFSTYIYVVTKDVTFTAVFEEIPQEPTTYTVKFVVDGIETVQTIEEGAYPILPEEPTKEGYTFQGWYIGDTLIEDVSTYPITENTTFTAVFSEVIKYYEVKFIVDGTIVKTDMCIEGLAISFAPEDPVKEGYTFQGWYVDDTLVDLSTYIVTSPVTFTAVFEEIPQEEPLNTTSASLFTFSDGMVTGYIGTESNVVIPKSYSIDETGIYEFASKTELKEFCTTDNNYPYTMVDANGNIKSITSSNSFLFFSATYPVTYISSFIDGDDYQVTSVSYKAFHNCTVIESLVIPDYITSFGDDAVLLNSVFLGCTNIKSLTIGKGLENININFRVAGFPSLETVIVSEENPNYYSENNAVIEKSSKTLIIGCKNTIIPNDVTSIEDYAFYGCDTLTSIVIPASITNIGSFAFGLCRSLTSIVIPEGITTINSSTFSQCNGLTSIVLPSTITSIGKDAFYDCTSLTTVNFTGTEAQWNAIEINSTGNTPLTSATINYNYTEE